jgi:hypothetical protein
VKWSRWLISLWPVIATGALLVILSWAGFFTAYRVAAGIGGVLLLAWWVRVAFLVQEGSASKVTKVSQTILTSLMMLIAAGAVVLAFTGETPSQTPIGKVLIGVWCLGWTVIALLALARYLLGFGSGIFGVARTVIDEAIHMKIAVMFALLMLVLLPALPFVMGEDRPLHYRVQSFLSYGLMSVSFLLSAMTIFLSCATLSSEIEGKQIFTIATKPIGRGAFILGKWLGIVVLDAVLMAVAGLAIYGFIVFYMIKLPAQDMPDALALQQEVLVARVSSAPVEPENLDENVQKEYDELAKTNPELIEKGGGEYRTKSDIRNRRLVEWRSVSPGGKPQVYRFEGLQDAKRYGENLQLRYKASTSKNVPGDELAVIVGINKQARPMKMPIGSTQVIHINIERFVGPDGKLEVLVANPNPYAPTLTFTDKGIEILYTVDSFGRNLFRAVLVSWVRLGFLAMLGLMAATFLSFPVACLLTVMVFIIGLGSAFLLEAVGSFSLKDNAVESILAEAMRTIGWSVATTLSKFSEYSPNTNIVEGRLFSWGKVGEAFFWLGLVWTGGTAAVAVLIYGRRELARVQV